MRGARLLVAVAVAGFAVTAGAQDAMKLEKGTEVRIASKALAAGWHEGEVTTAQTGTKTTCYGVSVKMTSSRTGKAVALMDGIDSIEVKVKQSDADKAAKKPAEWKRIDAKSLKDKYPACPKTNP